MAQDDILYGTVQSIKELGRLARAHRKQRRLTLEAVSGLGNLSMRFLSEFERGKETAEIGKVLKALRAMGLEVIIQPRGQTRPRSRTGETSKETT
ncbi:MAG: helix-turn-helix domain-containing protein [Gammaproteobacteria bacterium]|nr:helix-turn-helix domain-containing protein [Gammaproteobacteria bacterium]